MLFLICVVELAVKPRFELSKINLGGGVRPVMLVLVLVAPVLVLVVVGLVLVLVAPVLVLVLVFVGLVLVLVAPL